MFNFKGAIFVAVVLSLQTNGEESSLFDNLFKSEDTHVSPTSQTNNHKKEYPRSDAASSRSLFTVAHESQQLSSSNSKPSLFDSIDTANPSSAKTQTFGQQLSPEPPRTSLFSDRKHSSAKLPVVTGVSKSVSSPSWKSSSKLFESLFDDAVINSSSKVRTIPVDLSNPLDKDYSTVNQFHLGDERRKSDSLYNSLPPSKDPKSDEYLITKLSESVLQLGRIFQEKFLTNTTRNKKPENQNTKTSMSSEDDLKILASLLQISKQDSQFATIEELSTLKRLLRLIKVIENKNRIDDSSIDKELELLLAKSLLSRDLGSLKDLNRNERDTIEKVMKSMVDDQSSLDLIASGNAPSKTFHLPPSQEDSSSDELVERKLFVFSPPNDRSRFHKSPYSRKKWPGRRRPKPRPTPHRPVRPFPLRPAPPPPQPPPRPPRPSPVGPPPSPVGPPPSPVGPPPPPSFSDAQFPLDSPLQDERPFEGGFFLSPDQALGLAPVQDQSYAPPKGILPLEDEYISLEHGGFVPLTTSIQVADDVNSLEPLSDDGFSSQDDSRLSDDNDKYHFHYHIYANNYEALKDKKNVAELFSDDSSQAAPVRDDKSKYSRRLNPQRAPRRFSKSRFKQRDSFRSSSLEQDDDLRRFRRPTSTNVARDTPSGTRSRSNFDISDERFDNTKRFLRLPKNDNKRRRRPSTRLPATRQRDFLLSDESSYSTVPNSPSPSFSDPLGSREQQRPLRNPQSYRSPQADPVSNNYEAPVLAEPPPSRYGPPLASPQNSYGPPLASPQMNYGPPQADPQTSYGPPQADPQPSYGPPLASPQMSYGPPQANPVAPAPPTRTRVVYLAPLKGKKKRKKHKKGLFSGFSEIFEERDPQFQGLSSPQQDFGYSRLRNQRDALRDDYWRSRDNLENQQRHLFDLERLETEIDLQERHRDKVSRKILEKIAFQGFGDTVKSMFYKGATALGAMTLMPFRAFSRRKRSSSYLDEDEKFASENKEKEFSEAVKQYTINRMLKTEHRVTEKDLHEIQESLPPLDVIRNGKCLQQRLCFILSALKETEHLQDARQFFNELFPESASNLAVEEVFTRVSSQVPDKSSEDIAGKCLTFHCSIMPLDIHWL